MSLGHQVRLVCRAPLAVGFAAAGLEPQVVADGAEAAAALRRALSDERVGVVLVEDALHRALPQELRAKLDRLAKPIVTPFPGAVFDQAATAEDYVLEILRQAVGYRVRPR